MAYLNQRELFNYPALAGAGDGVDIQGRVLGKLILAFRQLGSLCAEYNLAETLNPIGKYWGYADVDT
jgi:hypothetical protein